MADLVEQPLGGGQVEGGQRGPGQVVGGAELDQAGDGEGPGRPGEQDAYVIAHLEVVLVRGADVHGHLGRAGRSPAADHGEDRQPGVGIEGEPDGRCSPRRDRLPVRSDELRRAGHRAVGVGHPGDAEDGRLDGLGDRLAVGGAGGVVERGLAAHHEVDVLVHVAEQGGERVVEGVGEHEGPRDERHPEHDGQRGQGQPQLVGQQPLDGDLPHVRSRAASSAPAPGQPWATPARPPRGRRPGTRPGRRRPPPGGRG